MGFSGEDLVVEKVTKVVVETEPESTWIKAMWALIPVVAGAFIARYWKKGREKL